jgi:hypothetical protein
LPKEKKGLLKAWGDGNKCGGIFRFATSSSFPTEDRSIHPQQGRSWQLLMTLPSGEKKKRHFDNLVSIFNFFHSFHSL